jgi:hypothetical protein
MSGVLFPKEYKEEQKEPKSEQMKGIIRNFSIPFVTQISRKSQLEPQQTRLAGIKSIFAGGEVQFAIASMFTLILEFTI